MGVYMYMWMYMWMYIYIYTSLGNEDQLRTILQLVITFYIWLPFRGQDFHCSRISKQNLEANEHLSGVGKCPNWTSLKYVGNIISIFEGDVQNFQKRNLYLMELFDPWTNHKLDQGQLGLNFPGQNLPISHVFFSCLHQKSQQQLKWLINQSPSKKNLGKVTFTIVQ